MTDSILTSYRYQTTTTHVPFPAAETLLIDIYSGAVAGYSFRKLSVAYAGSAVRIRRSSDNAESDFGFVGNDFDTAGASAFIGGGSGFLTTWYDQAASVNLVQASAALQPLYVASGINSGPTARFDGSDDLMSVAWTAQLNTGSSAFIVMLPNFSIGSGDYAPLMRWTSDANAIQYEAASDGNAPNDLEGFVNSNATTVRAGQDIVAGEHIFSSIVTQGANITTYKNGATWGGPTAITGSIPSSTSDTFDLGGVSGFEGAWDITEAVVYATARADWLSIHGAMNTYYTVY